MDLAGSPFRVEPGGLREATRLAADGLLVTLLPDVFVAADVLVDRELRSAAIRLALPERLLDRGAVITRLAAAWLWCGGPAPPRLDLAQRSGRGRAPGPTAGPGVVLHESRLAPGEVTAIGAIAVTTPARTAADLLCRDPHDRALAALADLAAHAGLTSQQVAEILERMPRARGVALARQRLAQAGSVDPLAGHPVGVEHALDPAHRGDHMVEVGRVGHLEGEP